MNNKSNLYRLIIFCGLPFLLTLQTAMAATNIKLSANGKAALPVVAAEGASKRVQDAAATLAEYLKRISGAEFKTQTGDGKSGLAVGTAADFPALPFGKEFDIDDPTQREDYILRSHKDGVYLIGATDQAVEHAVWDFLYRLGYRQFFPGSHWEVVPSTPNLSIAVDEKEHPDYYTRRIWFTYGTWPDNKQRMAQWDAKNRATSGIQLNTGHAYGHIVSQNKEEFDKHPEYFAEVGGQRRVPQTRKEIEGAKFALSNPGLRRLVSEHALRIFEKDPQTDSVSMDPSDGGGWGDSEAELKTGSISDRVTLLANEVAEAINKKYPGKYVGFYAYNFHSPPPSIKVHPNVVVSVATAFIKGGYSVDQLMEGWSKQGATLGMREYYSIIHWDKDLPRRARAANLDYMREKIPHFYNNGARFMSAESSDNWGPNGLGYYIASRLLWDVEEANRVDEIVDDFLEKSFGPAKEPMAEFYGLLNTGLKNSLPSQPLSDDFVGRLYRSLDKAMQSTPDPQIQARIGDLALYTRFIELYRAYTEAASSERLKAFENVIRHSYRIHDTHMVHSLAQYRTRFRDRSFTVPDEAHWQKPEKDNSWKSSEPYPLTEIRQMVEQGVKNNQLRTFEMVQFSRDLVPATPLQLQSGTPGALNRLRGARNFYTWIPAGAGGVTVEALTGVLFNNRGTAKLRLFKVDPAAGPDLAPDAEAAEEEEDEEAPPEIEVPEALDTVELQPDGEYHTVTLESPHVGLHRIQISDNMMGSLMRWADGTSMTMESSLLNPGGVDKRGAMYFYVPKGTKIVGVFASRAGRVRNAGGKIVMTIDGKDGQSGYIGIPVEPGEDGRLWRFENASSALQLLTVPPYMAARADELLLPREVVEADTPR